MTTAQAGALFFLTQHDGCLLLDLSRGLMLDKSAITRMAERLEKKNLIERRPCPQDGRAVRVFLTPSGRRAASRCLATAKAHNEAIKEGFSQAEIETSAGSCRRPSSVLRRNKPWPMMPFTTVWPIILIISSSAPPAPIPSSRSCGFFSPAKRPSWPCTCRSCTR